MQMIEVMIRRMIEGYRDNVVVSIIEYGEYSKGVATLHTVPAELSVIIKLKRLCKNPCKVKEAVILSFIKELITTKYIERVEFREGEFIWYLNPISKREIEHAKATIALKRQQLSSNMLSAGAQGQQGQKSPPG